MWSENSRSASGAPPGKWYPYGILSTDAISRKPASGKYVAEAWTIVAIEDESGGDGIEDARDGCPTVKMNGTGVVFPHWAQNQHTTLLSSQQRRPEHAEDVLTGLCWRHRHSRHILLSQPPTSIIPPEVPRFLLQPNPPASTTEEDTWLSRYAQRPAAVFALSTTKLTAPGHHADLRQDPHGQDYHPRGGVFGHHRQCQVQDSGYVASTRLNSISI